MSNTLCYVAYVNLRGVAVAQTLKIKLLPLPWQITAGQNLRIGRVWKKKKHADEYEVHIKE